MKDREFFENLLNNFDKNRLIELIEQLRWKNMNLDAQILEWARENKKSDDKAIEINLLKEYWEVVYDIVDSANDYGGSSLSEDEEVFFKLSYITEIVQKNDLPWSVRGELVDDILEQFNRSNSGFEDSLIDLAVELCQNEKEELYLADCLAEGPNPFYTDLAADIYQKHGKDEAFLQVTLDNLEFTHGYYKIVRYYDKHQEIDKAVSFAYKGIKEADFDNTELVDYLFNYYKKSLKIKLTAKV